MPRWIQWAVLLACLMFLWASDSDGQVTEHPVQTTFRIRYVSLGAVYVEGGRSAGLSEGTQDRPNRPLPCEGGHERHLGRSGIGETHLDTRGSGGREERVRSGGTGWSRHGKPLMFVRSHRAIRVEPDRDPDGCV